MTKTATTGFRQPDFKGTYGLSTFPIVGLNVLGAWSGGPTKDGGGVPPPRDPADVLDEIDNRDIERLRREELVARLRAHTLKAQKDAMTLGEEVAALENRGARTDGASPGRDPAKKFSVHPQTGVISIDEEHGDHTYQQALAVSTSIQGQKGGIGQALELLNATKSVNAGGEQKEPPAKKHFLVNNQTGEITKDTDNGDHTLGEAKSVSASIIAARGVLREEVTPQTLDALKRDILDSTSKAISTVVTDLKHSLGGGEGGGAAAFTIQDGQLQVSPNAKLTLAELLLYQRFAGEGKDATTYKDDHGNSLPLPDWLKIKEFEQDQKRQNDRHEAVTGLFKDGRKQLPGLIAGLRGLARPKETEEALQQGGWGGGAPPSPGGSAPPSPVKWATCPSCHKPVPYTVTPSIVACPGCGALDYFGAPGDLEIIRQQLAGEVKPSTSSASAPASKDLSSGSEPASSGKPSGAQ